MERSELNERIESCINEHCSGDGNGVVYYTAQAANAIERLVLQEVLKYLEIVKEFGGSEVLINKLQEQLNKIA